MCSIRNLSLSTQVGLTMCSGVVYSIRKNRWHPLFRRWSREMTMYKWWCQSSWDLKQKLLRRKRVRIERLRRRRYNSQRRSRRGNQSDLMSIQQGEDTKPKVSMPKNQQGKYWKIHWKNRSTNCNDKVPLQQYIAGMTDDQKVSFLKTYSLKNGLKQFSDCRKIAAYKDMKKLHYWAVFKPIRFGEMTLLEMKRALENLIFFVENRYGRV